MSGAGDDAQLGVVQPAHELLRGGEVDGAIPLASSLNFAFFTRPPAPVGEQGGGMANAIVGSGIILALASLMGPLEVMSSSAFNLSHSPL